MFSLGDIRFYECPLSYISADTGDIINLIYRIDDTKILLHPGGWGSQPWWLVEAYDIFKQEEARHLKNKSEEGNKG